MQSNVDRHEGAVKARGCERIECAVCDWFDPPNPSEFGAGADVILVADCVWLQELVQPLLTTLEKLVGSRNVQVIIAYQRRGRDAHQEFWSKIHSLFTVVRETDTALVGLRKPDCLYLLNCSSTHE